MTAKEYLAQAGRLDHRINAKLDMLAALKDMATRTTSVMSEDIVSHTRNVHSLQDVIAKIIDTQEEINAEIDRLVDLKREVTDVIRQVRDPSCQVVLEYRYLCYRSWEEIAEDMKLNVRSVYRLHGQALREVDAVLQRIKPEKSSVCQ